MDLVRVNTGGRTTTYVNVNNHYEGSAPLWTGAVQSVLELQESKAPFLCHYTSRPGRPDPRAASVRQYTRDTGIGRVRNVPGFRSAGTHLGSARTQLTGLFGPVPDTLWGRQLAQPLPAAPGLAARIPDVGNVAIYDAVFFQHEGPAHWTRWAGDRHRAVVLAMTDHEGHPFESCILDVS